MELVVICCLLFVCLGNASVELGESCKLPGNFFTDCVASNYNCGDEPEYICACKYGYTDSNGNQNIGGTCFKNLGTICETDSDCVAVDELGIICLEGKCACKSGWTDSNGALEGGTCDANHLGVPCTNTSECIPVTENSNCSDGICECEAEYIDTNGAIEGGACLLPLVDDTTAPSSPMTTGVVQQQNDGAIRLQIGVNSLTASTVLTTISWRCL